MTILLVQEILGEIFRGNKAGPGKGTRNTRKAQKGDNLMNLGNP